MKPDLLQLANPHLEGGPFFMEGGEVGVLLCHGFTATSAEVRPLAEALHAHGYTTAGPLLPGHGTTPADLNRTPWQEWYAAVDDCYQHLASHCSKVVVGGESLGSLLTLLLASHHPEIAAVLSYAPALRFHSRKTPLLAPLLARFIEHLPKPVRGPSESDARWKGYRVNPLRAAVQMLHVQRQVLHRLPLVGQPLLVVQGRLDQTISPASAELIYRRAGSAHKELHWFDKSGHCVLIDCEMESVNRLTLEFLERVLPLP
jgi:carboxylesterase